MPTTPNRQYFYPTDLQPATIDVYLKALADRAEAIAPEMIETAYGSRPAAGSVRRLHRATDRQVLSIDNGDSWDEYTAAPKRVGSLPTDNLYTGLEVDLVINASQGVVWRFKYNASSSSAFKWEAVPGSIPMRATSDAGASWGASTFAGFKDNLVTVPLAGDYDVYASCLMDTNGRGIVALRPSTEPASDARRIADGPYSAGGDTFRLTGLPAGTGFGFAQRVVSGNAMTSSRHTVSVTPIRVGT
jgi:hypothetical protein